MPTNQNRNQNYAQIPRNEFDASFVETIRVLFEETIAFNKVLGLKVIVLSPDLVECRIAMQPSLIGHAPTQRLHGGVISAGLDAIGGMAIMAGIASKFSDESTEQRLQRCTRVATIDMRIDYLRPGIGDFFILRGEVLRLGSRVGSTRMEFLGSDGRLLSTGAAAYVVS